MAKNKKDNNGGPVATKEKPKDGTPRRLNGKAFKKKPKGNPGGRGGVCGYSDNGLERLAEKKGWPTSRVIETLQDRQKRRSQRGPAVYRVPRPAKD